MAAFSWEVGPLIRSSRSSEIIPVLGTVTKRFPRNGSTPSASNSRGIPLRGVIGGRAVLIVGGQGEERARHAAQILVDKYPLKGLISIGFAGGLALGLKPGSIVMATEVIDNTNRERYPCTTTFLGNGNMKSGRLLCSSQVIAKANEKQNLGQQWDAIAVDMESAGVARVAQDAGIPFCAVKAISDSAEQSLSIDFNRCQREDNKLSLWAVLKQGLSSPARAGELCRLGWNSRIAAKALAIALSYQ